MLITIPDQAAFEPLRSAIIDTPEGGGFTAIFKRYERVPEMAPFVVGGDMGSLMFPKRYDDMLGPRSYGMSPTILARIMERIADEAFRHGSIGVGLWMDEHEGLWIDTISLYTMKEKALDVAARRKEIAIYDLAADEVIPVATDEKKTGNPLTRMLFGR
jgi:hypothetical protein